MCRGTHMNESFHTLQHTATHCDTLRQHTATPSTHCNTLRQHTATTCCHTPLATKLYHEPMMPKHCNTLQHNATQCNTLQQHTATIYYHTPLATKLYDESMMPQHCNTMQHTATTHCNNILQHTFSDKTIPRAHDDKTLQQTAKHCNNTPQQYTTTHL